MDHSSWQGQVRASLTLDLVTALRLAHDEAQTPVLWPSHTRHRRNSAERKCGAATAVIGAATAVGIRTPGVVASGEAAAMVVTVVTVGVATPTTAPEGTAAAEAEEACLMEVVAQDAVRISDEVARAVAAPLGEATVDDGTARVVVQLVMVPLSDHPRLEARTAARSLW